MLDILYNSSVTRLLATKAFWTPLTYWGRMTHKCVSKLTIIGSAFCLAPDRRQAIIWTNAGILLGTNFSENLIEIHTYSFRKMYLKMSSGKWRPFCLGLNVINQHQRVFTGRNTLQWMGDRCSFFNARNVFEISSNIDGQAYYRSIKPSMRDLAVQHNKFLPICLEAKSIQISTTDKITLFREHGGCEAMICRFLR